MSIKTVTQPDGVVTGKLLPVAIVLMISISAVSADPPPGASEVDNALCDTNSTPGGICDDYDSSLDQTTGDHWSKISVMLEMKSAEEIRIEVFIALHELPRDQLGLQQIDLGGDSTTQDGIPSDHIRNFFNEQTGNGETVSERMFTQADEMVMNVLGDNFESIGLPVTNTVSVVPRTLEDDISCTADSSRDSADEALELDNNPFFPPICIRSALSVTVNASSIGMDDSRGDLERALIGLLVMGAEVDLVFDLVVEAGQSMEMALIPPGYSECFISRNGTTLASRISPEGLLQRFAVVRMDRTNDDESSPPLSLSLDTSIIHLEGETKTVDLSSIEAPGIKAELTIDSKDTNNVVFGLEISLHHIDKSTLDEWSVDFSQRGVKMPWITSDGFRLLDEETDIGLERLLDGLPMESISESLSEMLGNEIELGSPFFSQTTENGGIQFLHGTNSGCDEEGVNRYCISGPHAMNRTFPIYISAVSNPISVDLAELLGRLIENSDLDVGELDFSSLSNEDLSRIASVGSLNLTHDLSWVNEGLSSTIPDSELAMKVELPNWVASGTGEPGLLTINVNDQNSDQKIILAGTRAFDWEHPICLESIDCTDESWDILCKSHQSTCISSTLFVDIQKISLKELSSSVIFDIDIDFTLDIHRIDVDLGIEGLETSPIPSDLIRHLISVGDRIEGGLLNGTDLGRIDSPFPDDNHPIELDISNDGMTKLADEIADRVRLQITEYSNMQHEYVEILQFGEYEPSFDLSRMPIDIEIENAEPAQSPYLSDLDPFKVGVSIENAQLRVTLSDDSLSFRLSERNIFQGVFHSMVASVSPSVGKTGVGPFSTRLGITPIDESTDFGDLRPVLVEEIRLPPGFEVLEFESDLSRASVIEYGGRDTLFYLTPLYECINLNVQDQCELESDTVTLSLEVGWQVIIMEMTPYIILIISVISFLFWRRWRRKIINRRNTARELEDSTMEWVQSLD
ncbi:MAG: hypothetical protein ACPHIY_01505 [Candidatus Thalassarchaeaceae archaeon]